MKKTVFILLTLLTTVPCFSQTLEKDSLNLDIKRNNLGGNISTNRFPNLKERNIFDDQSSLQQDKSIVSDEPSVTDTLPVNMRIYVPRFYQGPLNDYLSESEYPFANDYAYTAGYMLSDRNWLTTYSSSTTYLFVGSANKIGGTYNQLLSDNVTLSLGAYAAKYGSLNTFVEGGSYQIKNDMGANVALKYQVTDRIAIHGFGQYSVFSRDRKFDTSIVPGMYEQTKYGGAFEYKVNKSFGIMGGMERQLNPMTGKWKNVPFLAPVFYGK